MLLYTQPAVPVVLAIAEEPARDDGAAPARRSATTLPAALYVHVTPPLLDVLAERYAVEEAEPHLKLALARTDLLAPSAAATSNVLGAERPRRDRRRSTARRIPETWFEPRMLATGRYVGIRQDGRLACVAGVHVYSPTWSVAALGNVATLPELRGRGPGASCVRRPLPAPARGRDRDDRAQRPGGQRRRDRAPTRGSGSSGRAEYTEASLASASRLSRQRCPKWCARGSAAPTSSSATRRASAPRVSIEATRMLRFSPTRS